MKNLFSNKYIILVSRLFLGFIFLSFGMSKISDPVAFAKEIGNYDLLPIFSLNFFAIILPWIEIVIGILLILGIRLKANALIGAILMVIFIIMVAIAWARGLDISCGCSSAFPQKVGLPKILENSGLLFLSFLIYINPLNNFTFENFAKSEHK